MTEEEAKAWLLARHGARAVAMLSVLTDMIRAESERQNLISRATIDMMWHRHVIDSAQLVPLAPQDGRWIDIGTGAGFPGLVVGILRQQETILVEPRRRRVAFLESVIDALDLDARVSVRLSKIERLNNPADVISARAVASLEAIFVAAANCATRHTLWLLPKGQNAAEEVAQARRSWHGSFHVEQSITDAKSMIVVANGVHRR